MHTEPVLQLTSKVKKYGNDMGPLPPNIAGHIALHGCRLLHGQEDPMENNQAIQRAYLNVNLAIRTMIMNTTLRAAVHLRKDHDTKCCKELSLENDGTAFRLSLINVSNKLIAQ